MLHQNGTELVTRKLVVVSFIEEQPISKAGAFILRIFFAFFDNSVVFSIFESPLELVPLGTEAN